MQGVGCRARVEREVNALARVHEEPVLGWVRNLPGGEVEVVVQASREMIERIHAFVSSGLSEPVRVDSVSRDIFQDTDIINKFKSFRARRE